MGYSHPLTQSLHLLQEWQYFSSLHSHLLVFSTGSVPGTGILTSVLDPKFIISDPDPDPQIENQEFRIRIQIRILL